MLALRAPHLLVCQHLQLLAQPLARLQAWKRKAMPLSHMQDCCSQVWWLVGRIEQSGQFALTRIAPASSAFPAAICTAAHSPPHRAGQDHIINEPDLGRLQGGGKQRWQACRLARGQQQRQACVAANHFRASTGWSSARCCTRMLRLAQSSTTHCAAHCAAYTVV